MAELDCTPAQCLFPARAGQDFSIDGDVWAGSPLDVHLEICPSEPNWKATAKCAKCGALEVLPHARWCSDA